MVFDNLHFLNFNIWSFQKTSTRQSGSLARIAAASCRSVRRQIQRIAGIWKTSMHQVTRRPAIKDVLTSLLHFYTLYICSTFKNETGKTY